MKNHDEFRRTVFEKAKLYEAKRKARNKKIIETVSLCSLCLVIGISAYFALERDVFSPEACDTNITTPSFSIAPTDVINTGTPTPEAESTTTGAYMTTTAMQTIQTTVAHTTTYVCTTSIEATIATTSVQTTDIESVWTQESPSAFPTMPPDEDYIFHDIVPCTDADATPSLFVAKDYQALKEALAHDFSQTIPQNEQETLLNTYDEAFFENRFLLILHASNAYPYTVSFEDGHFTYTVGKAESTANDEHIFLIFSVSKDKFISATIENETP